VLLVDDVVTTGASLAEMVPLIEAAGGALVARTCARRSQRRAGGGGIAGKRPALPAQALWTLDLPTYEPGTATCPGCAAGLELVAPGSSGTACERR
jgi:orotate phosphoribosyltransferase